MPKLLGEELPGVGGIELARRGAGLKVKVARSSVEVKIRDWDIGAGVLERG